MFIIPFSLFFCYIFKGKIVYILWVERDTNQHVVTRRKTLTEYFMDCQLESVNTELSIKDSLICKSELFKVVLRGVSEIHLTTHLTRRQLKR